HPACRLDRAALDLVGDAVGIDGFAHVGGERPLLDADVLIALDLRDSRAIGPGILVAGIADAPAGARFARRLPARTPCGRADDVLCALILQMAQAKRDGILAEAFRDFVNETLDRERVALATERPERRGADRHRQQAMALDL